MFKQMPIILAILIILIISFGNLIPIEVALVFFSLSLTIKSAIIFVLPLIIFSLLYKSAVSLANDASKIIIIILLAVVGSNFIATSLAQLVGNWIYSFDITISSPEEKEVLKSTSYIDFPHLISNSVAMFSGIILGIINAKISKAFAIKVSARLEKIVIYLLKSITLVIPLFVAGFTIKLQADGIIMQIIQDYTTIFLIIGSIQYGYIILLYFIFDRFQMGKAVVSIRNMLPATLNGFSTMSSAASIPLTLIGTEKNAKNKNLVHTVVPASVNIHLIGDCIAIPCFAFAILKSYNLASPDIFTYFIFTVYFVMAKFSVAAIPGGGILVMLPILEQYLGFDSNMLSLITALYILFDPIITSANVMGNGAFAKMIDNICTRKEK